ncbi:polysaccharide deacetylase [Mycobacterium sp. BK558]|nr:polysaccharide deacetylase [Mycobacterium sp. BK558]
MKPKHRKSGRPIRLLPAMLTLLSAMAVAAYLILPGMWQWAHAEAQVEARKAHQVDTVPGPVEPELVERLRAIGTTTQAAPVIITYHDIGHNKSPYTVTPENFATQMRLIHDAGWTTLTGNQLSDWLGGKPLPPRSVMITFDDGALGVWQYADPVLKRFDQHASAFIITGFVGTNAPYYMTWGQIEELRASGRWDLEAHTHQGHVQIPSDDHGGKAPYLTTTQWLADQHRYETPDEYHARVLGDLVECKRQFALHGLPSPRFFAYPFSAHEDDPSATDNKLQQTVASLYRAAMLDDSDNVVATSANDIARAEIQRMDITANLSLADFSRKIDLASPEDPLAAQPLSDSAEWIDEHGAPIQLDISGPTITLNPPPGHEVVRSYAPIRATMWNDYTVTAEVGGLPLRPDETLAGISVLKPPNAEGQLPARVDVTVSANAYSVNARDLITVPPQTLAASPTHHLVVDVTDTQVSVSVDDAVPTVIDLPPHGAHMIGGGLSLYALRQSDVSPSLTFTNVTIS